MQYRCPSVDRIVSALYLQQYSLDPFHICTSYQATSEGVSHVKFVSKWKIWNFDNFFIFVTLTLSSFNLGYDSLVWVIMRRLRVSSERRRSSCSSYVDIQQCIYHITKEHILQNVMCSIQFNEELAIISISFYLQFLIFFENWGILLCP